MNILVDIGHPGHVHLFKNYFFAMQKRGHQLIFTTREKECALDLLKASDIPYINLGKPKKGPVAKLFGLLEFGRKIYSVSKKYDIDLYLSVSSMYAAHVSFLRGKKHIVLDDTEHSKFEHLLYKPFSDVLLNPSVFEKNLGKKQLKYDGFHELAYLHPNYFTPQKSIYSFLGLQENEAFSIVRFVSWNAGHDIKQKGLTLDEKIEVVKTLSEKNKVFITSEGNLPKELKKFQISIPPEKMHDALAFSNLYIGEGATMASECAMVGTPAIYVNSLNAGTLKAQTALGLLHSFRNYVGVKEKINEILDNPNAKKEAIQKAKMMVSSKIDLTQLLMEISENISDQKPIKTDEIKNMKAA